MLLINTLLISFIAIAVFREKTSTAEQAELIPVPISEKELEAQKTNK